MQATEYMRRYTAAQAIYEEEVIHRGVAEKSKEFVETGPEVYGKA